MELGFDWEATAATVVIDNDPLPDQRKAPTAYGLDRELSTGCKCNGNYKACLYGVRAPSDERCRYHRFGIMCDKLIINKEEMN